MDANEAMAKIKEAGWGGFSLWAVGESHYMACLLNPDYTPNKSTNLWNYAPTASDAIQQIAEKAARIGSPSQIKSEYQGPFGIIL